MEVSAVHTAAVNSALPGRSSPAMNGRSDRADEAPTVVWPAPARSRYVSEETVNAVMCLITGDWGDGHRGGAEEVVLVIPEGLILLFGLLSTTSVRPSVRCAV